MKKCSLLLGVILIISHWSCSRKVESRLIDLGQSQPQLIPQKFASQKLFNDSSSVFGSVFNRSMTEFYYAVDTANRALIRSMKFIKGSWSSPQTVIENDQYSFNDPMLSNDESRLYFISDLPKHELDTMADYDIWYIERKGNAWSHPINAGKSINSSGHEYYISFSEDGSMYFSSNRDYFGTRDHDFDIYKSQMKNGIFQPAVKVEGINTKRYEADVFVAPDESYIIFCSARKSGLGRGDLYISYKLEDRSWSKTMLIGPPISSQNHEICPFVTRDGLYFFYTSGGEIYWVNSQILKTLKLQLQEKG